MKSRIILITGGQRSGKSEFAEKLALEADGRPLYVATSRILDEEMERRVALHRARREDRWDSVDAPVDVASVIPSQRTVLVDCVTMWVTNLFFDFDQDIARVETEICRQLSMIAEAGATVIFVTNEIGLGGVSPDRMTRQFTDIHGIINRRIASMADDVYFIISGIPLKIK